MNFQVKSISGYIIFILYAFFLSILTIAFVGCSEKNPCSDRSVCEMLDSIELIMFQNPDSAEVLLCQVDTAQLSITEEARLGTIKGLVYSNREEYQKSIKELEHAEPVFEELEDDYHLYLNKLVRAFVFELISLDNNAAKLYIECESYFDKQNLSKLKFYASLGVLRMGKYLKISKQEKINAIENELTELDNPVYNGLYYASLAYIEATDSLRIINYENAKAEFVKAKYWSRVLGMDLNMLFSKIRTRKMENIQEYYDSLSISMQRYSPSIEQQLQYNYGQAYIYFKLRMNEESIEYTKHVLKDADKYNVMNVKLSCANLLRLSYERNGDCEHGYEFLKKHNLWEKERISELQKTQLLSLGAHYRYTEIERERLSLKVKLQRILIITVIAVLLAVIIFLVSSFKLKVNRQQKEILKLENIEIKDQIDKLISSLEKAENKSENLIKQVEDIKVQYQDSQEAADLLNALENSQIKTWVEYEAVFMKLKPGWIEKLKNEFPKLTPTDLKYCMCLYFNMNNYMISNLCDVGVDAVKSAKKRIRNKLSLDESSEIYFYLKKYM